MSRVDGTLESMVVNALCGSAAGNARPGIALALQHAVSPDLVFTFLPAPTSRPPIAR